LQIGLEFRSPIFQGSKRGLFADYAKNFADWNNLNWVRAYFPTELAGEVLVVGIE